MNSKTLQDRWTRLEGKKASILRLCEDYASYTLPDVFPPKNVDQVELQLMIDPIGARAVNHLSNRVVSVLYQPNQPFFKLEVDQKSLMQAAALIGAEDDVSIGKLKEKIDSELAKVESEAIKHMDMVAYRPAAVQAAKLLIITGNALMFHPENEPVQVFNLRDYCVLRDHTGAAIEIMTREYKAFETFNDEVQSMLRMSKKKNDYDDDSEVCIYTRVRLENDGKYHLYQAANDIDLDSHAVWTKKECPYIPLMWDHIKGEDYGRGYTAAFAGAFHGLKVLSAALLNIAGIMADLKYLVNPSSYVDVKKLNESPPGSYHSGKEGDVVAIQQNKQADAQFIQSVIQNYEKQIAEAYLLNASAVRDAERVTAEEVKMQAQELETSLGGIYSRLASIWQKPTADIVLAQIGFSSAATSNITPQIVTGMDSLSRQAEMDNFRMWVSDMQLLEAIPEDVRAVMDIQGYAAFCARNRRIEINGLMLSTEQVKAKQELAMQQQQQLQDQQTRGAVQVEAGKAAVNNKQGNA